MKNKEKYNLKKFIYSGSDFFNLLIQYAVSADRITKFSYPEDKKIFVRIFFQTAQ